VVGRTPDVAGAFTIEGTTLTATDMSVDLTTLETDDSRRDGQVQRALNTSEFPVATFSLTEPVDLGAEAETGPVSVEAVGELTINGTTQPATFSIDAELVQGLVVMVGSTDVEFPDYGVTVPSAPIVVSADDFGVIEFQLIAER
jgi:polyisoprenoid-binding protein YceI